jgi:hypothetical protein
VTGARILWRAGMRADALKAVQVALSLATDAAARQRAQELQQAIEREKP